MPIGTAVTGTDGRQRCRRLGFDKVFDTDTGADLTILEEGTELINRIKNGGKLPADHIMQPWLDQVLRTLLS